MHRISNVEVRGFNANSSQGPYQGVRWSMRRFIALALALTSAVAVAGDRIPVVQVKFSPWGTRVAATQAGETDGGGFGTARLDILNTQTGYTLYRRSRTDETGASASASASAVRAALLAAPPTPARLLSNGLTPGVNSVPRFVRRYPTPLPSYDEAALAGQSQTINVALWTVPVPIKLTVMPRPGNCPNPDLLNGYQNAGFTLKVRNQVIHTDAALPSRPLPGDRRCAVGYTVDRVDVRGNRILVTVRAYSIGFEGPDARTVFVTAKLR